MTPIRLYLIPSLAVLAMTCSFAHAGGVFIPGSGSASQPRAGAFVAKADDPVTLFENPAGLMKLKGTVFHLGFNVLKFSQEFQREGTYDATGRNLPFEGQPYPLVRDVSRPLGLPVQLKPNIAVSTDLGLDKPFRLALGIGAPNGYPNREYSPEYQIEADINSPPPPGRYDILNQEIEAISLTFGAAYRPIPNLDLGATFAAGVMRAKGKNSVWSAPNYSEFEGSDATFEVDTQDNFFPSFSLGFLFRPVPEIELGGFYKSQVSFNAVGDGFNVLGSEARVFLEQLDPITENTQCAPGGTVVRFKTCVDIKLPRQAGFGTRWIHRNKKGEERGDIEFDVVWEQWSKASDTIYTIDARTPFIPLQEVTIRRGFKDVFSFRLGGEFGFDLPDEQILWIRAGAAYDTETAPESWTRLDIDSFPRATLGLGVAYEVGKFRFDLGIGAVIEGSRTAGPLCNPDENNLGCGDTGLDQDVDDRTAPDPVQPTTPAENAVESPFNAGTYSQSYLHFSTGMTVSF